MKPATPTSRRCMASTCRPPRYGNSPALTLDFVRHLAARMPRQLCSCWRSARRAITGALCLRGGDTLYGRYWGASETLPGLHFETCYYQGIEYCLREGLTPSSPARKADTRSPAASCRRDPQPAFHRRPALRRGLGVWCIEERARSRARRADPGAHSLPCSRHEPDPLLDPDPDAPFPPVGSRACASRMACLPSVATCPGRLLNA